MALLTVVAIIIMEEEAFSVRESDALLLYGRSSSEGKRTSCWWPRFRDAPNGCFRFSHHDRQLIREIVELLFFLFFCGFSRPLIGLQRAVTTPISSFQDLFLFLRGFFIKYLSLISRVFKILKYKIYLFLLMEGDIDLNEYNR